MTITFAGVTCDSSYELCVWCMIAQLASAHTTMGVSFDRQPVPETYRQDLYQDFCRQPSIVDRSWRDIANLLQHRWTSTSWLPISWPISSKRRDYCTSFWFTFQFLETWKFKFSCKPLLLLSLPTVPTILVPVLFSDIHSTRMFLSFKEIMIWSYTSNHCRFWCNIY